MEEQDRWRFILSSKPHSERYAVFDLMGVLFKEGHLIRKGLHPFLKERGLKKSYSWLKNLYLKYSRGKVAQEKFWKIVPERLEKEFLDSLELTKNARYILKYFHSKNNVKAGLLSNIPKTWGEYLIEENEIEEYLTAVVLSGEYGNRKPESGLYEIFLEKTNTHPKDCYLIDDSLKNLKGAKSLSMKTVWKEDGIKDVDFKPDFTIKDLKELKGILN